jgi:hypothetical protein
MSIKNVLGHVLGDFFTDSSGHPATFAIVLSINLPRICMYLYVFVCICMYAVMLRGQKNALYLLRNERVNKLDTAV